MRGGRDALRCGRRMEWRCRREGGGGFEGGIGGGPDAPSDSLLRTVGCVPGEDKRSCGGCRGTGRL